jgi:integrase
MSAATIPLGYAAREGHIPRNPAEKFERFASAGPGRGCLTPKEAALVFSVEWREKRALAGNMLAMTTGLRHGEALALRAGDIDPVMPILHVRRAWSPMDGLKCPKNGEARKVPLLPEVRKLLLEVLEENPHGGGDPFFFYGQSPDKPRYVGDFMVDGLRDAMKKAGVEAGGRRIDFHSWRHFYAARMADRMTAEQVRRVTGHKSKAVFEMYADHILDENVLEMLAAGAEVFGKILRPSG